MVQINLARGLTALTVCLALAFLLNQTPLANASGWLFFIVLFVLTMPITALIARLYRNQPQRVAESPRSRI